MLKKILLISLILSNVISLVGQTKNNLISAKDTVTDKNIIVPEGIERNFDQLLVDWRKELKRTKNCSTNFDNNIIYSDSVYINRLYKLPTIMELAYNSVVRSYIDMYTGRMRGSVEVFLGKSHYMFPIFERYLDKYGLPLELKYLPVIESALNPTAVSRVGATGLWQFMIGTGKMYGLEINSLVDERRDPYRSTEAAVRYLNDLYNIYGDWNLVIAAYNCGPGNVNKAIKRSGGQTDYWSIYPYLPKETRGYVPAFIAATYAMNYYSAHNICPLEYSYLQSTDTIEVDHYLHFEQLSQVLNIPTEQLRKLNPQFKNDIVPGDYKKYILSVPSSIASTFGIKKDEVYAYQASNFPLAHRKVVNPKGGEETSSSKIRHKVRRNESISSIASKYQVTVAQIKKWNGLKSNKLRLGQMLAIYKTVSNPQKKETDNAYYANNKLSTKNYTKPSNTPDSKEASSMLAQYFNKISSTSENIDKNVAETSGDVGESGSSGGTVATGIDAKIIYHKIRSDETLDEIAEKYNTDKKSILKWNNLRSVSSKQVGQRLIIHLPNNVVDDNEVLASADSASSKLSPIKDKNKIQEELALFQKNGTDHNTDVEQNSISKKNDVKRKDVERFYVVKKGDTLGHIASKLGREVSVKDIMKVNSLRSVKLKIGQKLRIPR